MESEEQNEIAVVREPLTPPSASTEIRGQQGQSKALIDALRRLAVSPIRRGAAPLDAKETTRVAWRLRGRRRPLDTGMSAGEVAAALAEEETTIGAVLPAQSSSADSGGGTGGRKGCSWTLEEVVRHLDLLRKWKEVLRKQSGDGWRYIFTGIARQEGMRSISNCFGSDSKGYYQITNIKLRS